MGLFWRVWITFASFCHCVSNYTQGSVLIPREEERKNTTAMTQSSVPYTRFSVPKQYSASLNSFPSSPLPCIVSSRETHLPTSLPSVSFIHLHAPHHALCTKASTWNLLPQLNPQYSPEHGPLSKIGTLYTFLFPVYLTYSIIPQSMFSMLFVFASFTSLLTKNVNQSELF